MARPNRSLKTIALLAALTALMGVVATGCGTSDDDAKQEDKTEEPGSEATEDGAATDEDAAGDEATDESGDEEATDEGGEEATDEGGEEPAEDEEAADEDA